MSNATSLPPAGWYPNEASPGQERWWDGNGWTEHSRAQQIAHVHGPGSSGTAVKCPRCGSDDAKTLRAVRDQGTSTGTGTATGWVSGSGDQPGHSANFHTTTTSYTAAARAAAPPRKHNNGIALIVAGPFLGLIIGIAVVPLWAGIQLSAVAIVAAVLVPIIVMIIGGVLLPNDIAYNRWVFPEEFQRWSRSWLCQRCGEVFAV